MNIVTVLHNKAMEFADEALLARMEGDTEASAALFEKAFELEKEAAEAVQEGDRGSDSMHILMRSAAALALNCGRHYDAELLIQSALSSNPPDFISKELGDLKEAIHALNRENVGWVEVAGILTYADSSEGQIRLQDIRTKEIYHITVPGHLINEIVKSYWADIVQVKALRDPAGAIVLDKITKAA
ncbi:MAG: hypothetical protein KIPDCIKN_00653 [Haliscomenobacter sp.]|nr:hypothetical protein [Haliscomenobacter sp.]